MKWLIYITTAFIIFLSIGFRVSGQCALDYKSNQSPKVANYSITVNLDHQAKSANCTQKLSWKNTSPDTLLELRFYMYMNAFKDLKSSYLRDAERKMFGQDLSQRTKHEWGHISIDTILDGNRNNLSSRQQYIQPDDQNKNDQSVLCITLAEPLQPGQTLDLYMTFEVKLPKTIVRSGYGKDDFFLFVHWFPQVCVYEKNKAGIWQWNSHQFLPGTEFFADFGDYEVEINASDHLVIGASGCRVSKSKYEGRQRLKFIAHDLIDFGWVAYPNYEVYTSTYGNTDIEILMTPEHCAFADRYLTAIEHGLEYLEANVGTYPYPKITVVDPPVHTLNSGFMEYPMMITGATAYGIPKNVRSVESLIIHEFTHMYFMATLASNEKEEAWLDEGFVTYYEDRILDHYYGDQSSLFDIFGIRSGNAQQSRNEYVSLPNPNMGTIARPGYEFNGGYKALIYAKTATALKTLEAIVGRDIMDEIVQYYYNKNKFTHPKEADLRNAVQEILDRHQIKFNAQLYLDQILHKAYSVDFKVASIVQENNGDKILIQKIGDFVVPVDIAITYTDESQQIQQWDGSSNSLEIIGAQGKTAQSVYIDPQQKIYIDLNLNNNSLTLNKNNKPFIKYAAKVAHWFQSISQWSSFIM